jgi:hypothetical protein
VNWYAHAVLAESRCADPACLLGAMLPDLVGAVGLRAQTPRDPALCLGFRLHAAADAAFHAAPEFGTLVAAGREALEAAGVVRGSARAAAHVGIELLLDGWLAARQPPSTAFADALARAPALAEDAALFRPAPEPERWRAFCAGLSQSGLPLAYRCPERAALGVERALARRPRLALRAGERPAVASWLAEAAEMLAPRAPALLARAGAAGPRP